MGGVTITCHEVAPNTLLGFKALPSWDDGNDVLARYHTRERVAVQAHLAAIRHAQSQACASSPLCDAEAGVAPLPSRPATLTDWGGLYVQLTFASSIHYLPNQWDRGETQAQVVAVYTMGNEPLPVLCCHDARVADPNISSAQKAATLRESLRDYFRSRAAANAGHRKADTEDTADADIPSLDTLLGAATDGTALPLLASLGLHGYALCLPDAEVDACELVLPHMLHTTPPHRGARFRTKPLFHFTASTRLPGCTGAVHEVPTLASRDVADPVSLAATLRTHLDGLLPADVVDSDGVVRWWTRRAEV